MISEYFHKSDLTYAQENDNEDAWGYYFLLLNINTPPSKTRKAMIPIIQDGAVEISLSRRAEVIPVPIQFKKPTPIPKIPAITITTADANFKKSIRSRKS